MNIQDMTLMSGVPADRKYARDASGNVTSIATSSSAPGQAFGPTDVQCFAYDGLQNLTEAWTSASASCEAPASSGVGGVAPYWSSYTFDKATGNRLPASKNPLTVGGAAVTDTYAYPAAGSTRPHGVKTVTPSSGDARSYSYDAVGNVTARPGQSLTWDDLGRLVAVKSGSTTQSRVYDAEGVLLLQSDPVSGTTLFVGANEFTIAPGASAVSGVRTYSMGDAPFAQRVSKVGVSGTSLQWLGGDANGTQDLQMDDKTGEIVHRYVDPYGNPRGSAVSWGSSHGYLNKPMSQLTGLTNLGARDYDPSIGKFVSVDPVLAPGNPRQNNGYGYSANNPITLSDPDGKCYVSNKDALSFNSNCGGGVGAAAPQVPIPGESRDYRPKGPAGPARSSKSNGPAPKTVSPAELWDTDPTFRMSLWQLYWPEGVNCATDVAVGSTSSQLAINSACGGALSQASLLVQEPWVRDLAAWGEGASIVLGAVAMVAGASKGGRGTGAYGTSAALTTGDRLEGVLAGAQFEKYVKSIQFAKPGGYTQAKADFQVFTRGTAVTKQPNGTLTAVLEDGIKLNVRAKSSGDRPTLEFQNPDPTIPSIKIRY